MLIEIDRWVKLYDKSGEIVIVKQLAIKHDKLVERISYCDNCQAYKQLGATACEGCAG